MFRILGSMLLNLAGFDMVDLPSGANHVKLLSGVDGTNNLVLGQEDGGQWK